MDRLRVLILEDRGDDAELALHELRQAGFIFDWRRVHTAEDFVAQLGWPPDVVLADYTLPQFDALRALRMLQERDLDMPFIVITGSLSEEVAVECMKQGATDYLLKDRLTRLGPAVRQALEQKRLRDERKRADERIRASLREKEVLLKEIQHRVKNNLQVIASLLSLQSGQVKDADARQVLKAGQTRVRAMALVHQKLYQSPDLAQIGFTQYLHELTTQLFNSFGVDTSRVSFKVTGTDVYLGIDTAIPCALIVNELVSNSLRHAFPDGRSGEICIDFRNDSGLHTLTVSDTGIGLPSAIPIPNPGSLGWQLIQDLTDQLDGRMAVHNGSGTAFQFTFNELKYRERGCA
jgi:two-component sensor histidine kinase/CheY-like chemotaxis protein